MFDLSVYYMYLQYFDTVGWVFWPVKTCLPYNLYCVGGDVKHCSIQSNRCLHLALCGACQKWMNIDILCHFFVVVYLFVFLFCGCVLTTLDFSVYVKLSYSCYLLYMQYFALYVITRFGHPLSLIWNFIFFCVWDFCCVHSMVSPLTLHWPSYLDQL